MAQYQGNPGLIVKPDFDGHGGGGIIATQPGVYTVYDAEGNEIEQIDTKNGTPGAHGIKTESEAIHNGIPEGGFIRDPSGNDYYPTSGGNKDYFETGNPKPVKSQSNAGGGGSSGGGGSAQGMFPVSGGGFAGGGPSAVPLPSYIDPSNLYQPFQPTDILGFAGQTAEQNRQQYQQSFADAQNYAQQLIQSELTALEHFAPQAQGLQQRLATQGNIYNRGEIATSNKFNQGEFAAASTFNQSELDRVRDKAAPFIRPTIESAIQRNSTYAQGKLLSTAEDRAFELTARNAAADTSFVSGFGADSAIADKASTLLSAQQRLNLSMQGDSALSNWIGIANQNLVSRPQQYTPLIQQPLQSTTAADIKGQPSMSGSQLAVGQQGMLNPLTTITPESATQMQSQQNMFGQQFDFQQRAAVYSALQNYANQQLGQLNQYAGNTMGLSQQLMGLNAGQSSLSSGGTGSGGGSPIIINQGGGGGGGFSPGGAPVVASQANVSRGNQLTSDLFQYYQ